MPLFNRLDSVTSFNYVALIHKLKRQGIHFFGGIIYNEFFFTHLMQNRIIVTAIHFS